MRYLSSPRFYQRVRQEVLVLVKVMIYPIAKRMVCTGSYSVWVMELRVTGPN